MCSLIDLLEKVPADDEDPPPGRYDRQRGLRVDARGRPVVERQSLEVGTGTRGGRDQDDGVQLRSIDGLGTVTKARRDFDHLLGFALTKTGGGRDTDDPRSPDGLSTPFGNTARK